MRAKPLYPGDRFASLTVISDQGKLPYGHRLYLCRCDCGNESIVTGPNLRQGHTRSCGCLNKQIIRERSTTHGRARTPEHRAWNNMKVRCYNPNFIEFHRYGGRGISVCDRWLSSFENFFADMGEKPTPKHSLDRIDLNGNYCPENCRWATQHQQFNNRSTTHKICILGLSLSIKQWSIASGVSDRVIWNRLKLGWSPERAVCQPVRRQRLEGSM